MIYFKYTPRFIYLKFARTRKGGFCSYNNITSNPFFHFCCFYLDSVTNWDCQFTGFLIVPQEFLKHSGYLRELEEYVLGFGISSSEEFYVCELNFEISKTTLRMSKTFWVFIALGRKFRSSLPKTLETKTKLRVRIVDLKVIKVNKCHRMDISHPILCSL